MRKQLREYCLTDITVMVERIPKGYSSHKVPELDSNVVEVYIGRGNTAAESDHNICEVTLPRLGGLKVVGGDEFSRSVEMHLSDVPPAFRTRFSKRIEKVALEWLCRNISWPKLMDMLIGAYDAGETYGRGDTQDKIREALGLE